MKALLLSRKLLCTLGILWGTRTFVLGLGGWLLFGHQSGSEYVSFTLTLMSLLPASIAAFFVPRAVAVAETFVCVVAIIFTYRTRSAHGGEWYYVLIAANLLFVGCLILIEFLLAERRLNSGVPSRRSVLDGHPLSPENPRLVQHR